MRGPTEVRPFGEARIFVTPEHVLRCVNVRRPFRWCERTRLSGVTGLREMRIDATNAIQLASTLFARLRDTPACRTGVCIWTWA